MLIGRVAECICARWRYLLVADVGGRACAVARRQRRLRQPLVLVLVPLDDCCRCRRLCSRLLRLCLFLLFVQLLDRLDLLLQLHTSVLEPDFDLAFGQAERVRHLDPPPPGQVVVRVELFLQLQRLVPRVRLSTSSAEAIGTWTYGERNSSLLVYVKLTKQ